MYTDSDLAALRIELQALRLENETAREDGFAEGYAQCKGHYSQELQTLMEKPFTAGMDRVRTTELAQCRLELAECRRALAQCRLELARRST